jgi:Skp family chaperone for outer membrane proteins
VQAYVHQREQELQQGFQSVAQTKQVAESVLSEFMPYAEQLQKEGATPVTAIRTLLQTAHQLRTGGPEYKKAILLSLAEQYGVDLVSPLNSDLAKAQAEAANLSTERIYGQSQQNLQLQQQMQQELASFAGDPAHEHFNDVRPIMGELIGRGVAKDLQTAYDMAIGMHAGVREKLIANAVAQHTAASNKNERAARAASISAIGAPGGTEVRSAAADTDLRASIAAAMGE